jgi:hypothetical protein
MIRPRLWLDLDELERLNSRSIVVGCEWPDGSDAGQRRDGGTGRIGGLPARPDLIARERPSLAVLAAVAELGGDGTSEVPAGPTSGARSVTDPASRCLCLGCPAMRTAPQRHGLMVAAGDPSVDYGSMVITV